MAEETKSVQCFSCEISETKVPLVTLQFNSGQIFVCPQCLPTLIHKPDKIAGKLTNIEPRPAPPCDH